MTIPEAAAFFRENDRFLILTHRGPDGDAVGSACALCRGLRALGKTAAVLENPTLTPRYAPWLEGLTKAAPEPGDLAVSVDLAAENQFPENAKNLTASVELAVDHHGSNSGYAKRTLLEPSSASCGELIYALLRELDAPLDQTAAGALYVAVATDTGCFQFSNTTANSLRVAAGLRERGIDAAGLNRKLFGVKTLGRLRLEARLTETVELLAGGKAAVCRVPLALVEELGLREDDMDALASFPRAIEGVEAGILLREKKSGEIKISIRSGPAVNASRVCARLGGGGHPAAAGASVRGSMEEAAARVLDALSKEGTVL